jgi:uncharacterized protein (DUF39 family)
MKTKILREAESFGRKAEVEMLAGFHNLNFSDLASAREHFRNAGALFNECAARINTAMHYTPPQIKLPEVEK